LLLVLTVRPVLVGGAVLAEQPGGAAALGTVVVGFGAGSLLGLLAAGTRPTAHRGAVLIGTTTVTVPTR
jgi:hypothetical protein